MSTLKLVGAFVSGFAVLVGSCVGTVVLLIQHDRRRVARQRQATR